MSTLSALLTASASSPLAYMSAVTFWLGRSRASYRPDPETSMSCSTVFLSTRRLHTRYLRDWSSDVCSSDLRRLDRPREHVPPLLQAGRGRNRGARRPARVHGLGGPDPHGLGRLSGLLPPPHDRGGRRRRDRKSVV